MTIKRMTTGKMTTANMTTANMTTKSIKTANLKKTLMGAVMASTLAASSLAMAGLFGDDEPKGIPPKVYTDSLFAVMKADRTNYTKLIIGRLGPKGAASIVPAEHWKDLPNGAPLPAQMFRAGSEAVADMTSDFTYSLQSIWPINKQNAPRTDMEKEGLEYIGANPGKNFYGEEKLGGTTYFTAVYPDVAVAAPCVSCHNGHKDSPKTDFKMGDVMGGVVIRVPLAD